MSLNQMEQEKRDATEHSMTTFETNDSEHPSKDEIYLFNLEVLSPERMDAIAVHLEDCWRCDEIFSEFVRFQELEEKIEVELLESLADAPVEKTIEAVYVPTPGGLKIMIQTLLARLYPTIPSPVGAASKDEWKEYTVTLGDREVRIWAYLGEGRNFIEIFTKDPSSIGEKLVIKDAGTELIACEFESDATTREMVASAFFTIPKNMTSEQIREFMQRLENSDSGIEPAGETSG